MNQNIEKHVLEDHTHDGLRSGEGAIVELADGRLYLLYTLYFDGGGDASPAYLARRVSSDQGATWSEPVKVFEAPEGAKNVMSVSLLRLRDGRIGAVYLLKWGLDHCIPMWTVSTDEAETWSEPRPVTDDARYFVVNNDRLIQLADGTLAVPYAVRPELEPTEGDDLFPRHANMPCGLFYSRDAGATWSRSPHEIAHSPEVFVEPLFCDRETATPQVRYLLENRLGVFQEPGVVELRDGRLMMFMRSTYTIYRAFAAGCDAPWEECGAFEGFHVCCGPQTIKRVGETDRLLMLYNDRGTTPFGDQWFSQRTPLSVAVSDDEGRHWRRVEEWEDDSHNYCYFSLLFHGDRFISSYYQSGIRRDAQGNKGRRNLASLKICRGPAKLYEPG